MVEVKAPVDLSSLDGSFLWLTWESAATSVPIYPTCIYLSTFIISFEFIHLLLGTNRLGQTKHQALDLNLCYVAPTYDISTTYSTYSPINKANCMMQYAQRCTLPVTPRLFTKFQFHLSS